MKYDTLKESIFEAKRFIDAAEKCCERCKWVDPGKEAAAVKRSSMDLSKKLSQLRNEDQYQ